MICRRIVLRHTLLQSSWFSSAPSTSHQENQKLNRTVHEGIVHVTSLNVLTEAKSIVQLKAPIRQPRKFRREFNVPEQAISGLRNALLSCERSPKQIQHEADQLSEVLLQRRFPAPPSVVREARNKVKLMLKEKEQEQDMCDLLSEDLRTGINYKMRNEVDKILKKSHFNWQPLAIETKEAAAAYALSRFAPNYAEISRVLDEFEGNTFSPDNVLDYGCGIGAGFWAVNERYGSAVKDYCMVDPSVAMTKFAMDIMRANDGGLLHRSIIFRRHLLISPREKYDLVIAHRTLCEFDSRESRLELIASLWKRTKRFLVLIDSGLHDAYEALMEARDFLLLSGTQLHLEDTISLLKVRDSPVLLDVCNIRCTTKEEQNLMNENIYAILHDDTITDFERFCIIHDLVPPEVILPTALPPAKVYAPCPHDLGCPKLTSRSSCTFPVRWRVIRADGKRSTREISGMESGKFSFVILEKCVRHAEESFARILKVGVCGIVVKNKFT